MSICFDYPRQTAFGRIISKDHIYSHVNASKALKDRFVDQVDRIIWSHVLAARTLNLSATKAVPEIGIITIRCKLADIDQEILKAIDKAIPRPLIFELIHGAKRKMVAGYKRPSEADSNKWVTSLYFSSAWEEESMPRQPLPQALDLGTLYEAILATIMPSFTNEQALDSQHAQEVRGGMSDMPQAVFDAPPAMPPGIAMAQRVARIEEIQAQEREIERIRVRLGRTRQFNKRVEINGELREAMQQLEALKRSG